MSHPHIKFIEGVFEGITGKFLKAICTMAAARRQHLDLNPPRTDHGAHHSASRYFI